ncbi:hypothetical protein ACFSQJ_15380 [Croceitalea marina]|uniref:Uncharacterized protein n=1 Tax=Croceitalea marina TaxID=1775166 RepID=A0ABW5MZT7_9FLAO
MTKFIKVGALPKRITHQKGMVINLIWFFSLANPLRIKLSVINESLQTLVFSSNKNEGEALDKLFFIKADCR